MDKVINLGNHRRTWVYPDADPDGNASLCYVAKGESGIATGPFRRKGKRRTSTTSASPFSSQPGFEYTYWPSDLGEDGNLLELAYALTVHKAQGSEFETVFVVLPNPDDRAADLTEALSVVRTFDPLWRGQRRRFEASGLQLKGAD